MCNNNNILGRACNYQTIGKLVHGMFYYLVVGGAMPELCKYNGNMTVTTLGIQPSVFNNYIYLTHCVSTVYITGPVIVSDMRVDIGDGSILTVTAKIGGTEYRHEYFHRHSTLIDSDHAGDIEIPFVLPIALKSIINVNQSGELWTDLQTDLGDTVDWDRWYDYTTCSDCDALIDIQDSETYAVGRYHICESCYDDNYHTCEDCGEIIHTDESVRIGSEQYCDTCANRNYIVCPDCGQWHSNDTGLGEYCESCSDNYCTCEDCGEIVHVDHVYWSDSDDCYCCEHCYSNHDRVNGGLHDYNYTPGVWNKYGTGLHMGIELETDGAVWDSDYWEDFINDESEVLAKYDGSLDRGGELVFHPRSIDSWLDYTESLDTMRKCALENGLRSHDTDTCGFHIHVSRDGLNSLNVSGNIEDKIIFIMERYWPELVKLSRRKSAQLTRWSDRTLSAGEECTINNIKEKKGTGRYRAVNIQPKHTVEFRMFRGTLKTETILATLELVNNICKCACATPESDIVDITLSDILQGTYLPAYAEQRGINIPIDTQLQLIVD